MPTFRAGFAQPLEEPRDEFDRLWTTMLAAPSRQVWSPAPATGSFPAVNVPAVNIGESDDCLTIEAELPGLDASDVEISVTGDELFLKSSWPEGSRPESSDAGAAPGTEPKGNGESQRVTWHRRERSSGAFERRISLPVAVDASRVEARLTDGVLTITCPKAAEAQPHRVTVRST